MAPSWLHGPISKEDAQGTPFTGLLIAA